MRIAAFAAASLAAAATFWPAQAGHEPPIYPSYYPQEIRIETVAPGAASGLLVAGKIHAYAGRMPAFAGATPKSLRSVDSLASYIVVRINPDSPAAASADSACAVAGAVIRGFAADVQGFVAHPYPVTPYHADYLHHADLAEAARTRLPGNTARAAAGLKLRSAGALADRLVPQGRTPPQEATWDASVEEIDLAALLAADAYGVNGWVGPPWLKAGWFHAYRLLGSAPGDAASHQLASSQAALLQSGRFADAAERIDLERRMVGGLSADCRNTVAGYGIRAEYYNGEYSDGLENVARDSHAGLNSAIFIRTVKLKDFPWNGWLAIGVPAPPSAAWNPFGGFGDDAGRLVWQAVGDPGLFPEPYSAGWIMNRFGDVQNSPGP